VYDFPGDYRIRLLFGHPSRFVVLMMPNAKIIDVRRLYQ